MESIHILRGAERLLIVALGGLTIYLGFMLFKLIPKQRDNQGKVMLPGGISIFLSRVGPGVFFALFGALIIAVAMLSPVDTLVSQDGRRTVLQSTQLEEPSAQIREQELERERLRVRIQVQTLNTLPEIVRSDLSESQKQSLNRDIKSIKLDLMHRVWGDWGDFQQFEDWANRARTTHPPMASRLPQICIATVNRGGLS